jgi:hypothetical protein
MSNLSISHNRDKETLEAKVRWFQSLTLEERMDLLCAFTEFILVVNPKIVEKRYSEPTEGSVHVLSLL